MAHIHKLCLDQSKTRHTFSRVRESKTCHTVTCFYGTQSERERERERQRERVRERGRERKRERERERETDRERERERQRELDVPHILSP